LMSSAIVGQSIANASIANAATKGQAAARFT